MITDMPTYAYITFFIAILFSLVMFYYASNKSSKFIIAIMLWGTLHSILGISGFYKATSLNVALMIFPMPLIILTSLFSTKMKIWLSTFNLKQLTYLHTVRIPVELVLFWLFIAGYAPEIITFEGRNFDVLAGITAPIVALVAFKKKGVNKSLLMIWNILSSILLVNILATAVLSMPTVLQQFGFEQPNVAVMKFPFLLLPTIIIPIVLTSIMASFVILSKTDKKA